MKKNTVAILIVVILAVGIGVTGAILKGKRKTDSNTNVGDTKSDANKSVDELDSDESLAYEEELWADQKEQVDKGSLRKQYEAFEWQGWQYTLEDMRVYKDYYLFQESDDYDGVELDEVYYRDGKENYVYVVNDIRIKNISAYDREYLYNDIELFCLEDDGRHYKYINGKPGEKGWGFSDVGGITRPINGAKTNPNNWKNGGMEIASGEEITISIVHRVSAWEVEVSDAGEENETILNPYDKYDHLNFYIRIAGSMTDPTDSSRNEFYDVENDKYHMIVKCEPKNIKME